LLPPSISFVFLLFLFGLRTDGFQVLPVSGTADFDFTDFSFIFATFVK